ncbi:MAG: D-alanyl-D-alanine carboxypeptidase/D-alanyl-D-alanine-endopeptidase [Prevotella sp.]|nr:D-alanyl-D-alanine carboxypeptidase/D-alanyl-D-alanine-endopeptidase [Prevotella sp.]
MNRIVSGLLLLLWSNIAWAQSESVSNLEEALPWPLGVQQRLDSMMRDPLLDTTQAGLMVWDLSTGRSLFCYNHRQIMRPASTMKLLTAITALDQLGGQHSFSTSLYYKGTISGSTLHGDLYCVGGMDPMFDYTDMDSLVQAVKELGVNRIIGRVVADTSMKDTLRWGEGWCWDDDNVTLTPLLVGCKDEFTQVLLSKLKRSGVDIMNVRADTGTLRTGTGSAPTGEEATLITRRSHNIADVLHTMMKESDNLYAECMFYQVAASSGHQPARAIDAARLERALIERVGLDSQPYRIADGSGLSLYNYLSAELEVALLRYAYQRVDLYDRLLPSLPLAGVDGTLKKRMKGTAAEGNVQAKTGTLTGVISLAGYLTAASGHRLCFAILNQGTLKASEAREFQDKICRILCEE